MQTFCRSCIQGKDFFVIFFGQGKDFFKELFVNISSPVPSINNAQSLKIPWKTHGKLREFSFSKMWSSCHNFNLKLIIKAVQIVDSSKITHMIRCAWNASSMYRAFRIVPQLQSDTPYCVKRVNFDKEF